MFDTNPLKCRLQSLLPIEHWADRERNWRKIGTRVSGFGGRAPFLVVGSDGVVATIGKVPVDTRVRRCADFEEQVMFANFRSLSLNAAMGAAVLFVSATGSADAAASARNNLRFEETTPVMLDANAEPLWIVYWWRAGDPQSSVVTRSSHNCGRGPLGEAFARHLQQDLITAGYSAVVVSQQGE